jgi:hypothetical protein
MEEAVVVVFLEGKSIYSNLVRRRLQQHSPLIVFAGS